MAGWRCLTCSSCPQTTLECTLRPGLVYNKVNPIFHHWSLGDCKFGLTFQSPAEADEFQRSLLAALAALGQGEWYRWWALGAGVEGWEKLGHMELILCFSPCPRLTHSLLLFLLLPFSGHCRDPLPSDGEFPGPALLEGQGFISVPQPLLSTCCVSGTMPQARDRNLGPNYQLF